jgi:hypothetical protein
VSAASFRPALQVPQLHAQDRALHALHAVIETAQVVIIAARFAPASQEPDGLGVIRIRRYDCAGFAISPEVLAGIKTEAREIRQRPRALSFIFGSVSLRRVLNHGDATDACSIQNGSHVGRLSV